MGEGRHTPGPWRFVNEPNNRFIVSESRSTDDGDAMLVFDLDHGAYDYSDYGFSVDANARLIAAAPDLLSAAKRIGGELATAYHEKRRLTRDEMFALMSWAVAAVAKAEPFVPSPSEAHAHG